MRTDVRGARALPAAGAVGLLAGRQAGASYGVMGWSELMGVG
jgi:hypothetical protein